MSFLGDIVGAIGDFVDPVMSVVSGISDVLKPVSGVLGDLSPYASAYGAYMGQSGANEMNLQIARETSDFNAQQAALNREFQSGEAATNRAFQQQSVDQQQAFQEYMSNTSYQRAVTDMQHAGLNPMLAVMRGGASTPQGSSAGGAQASGSAASGVSAHVDSPALAAINTGMAAARTQAEVANTKANTELVKANVDKVRQDTAVGVVSAREIEARTAKLNLEQNNLTVEYERLIAERENIKSETARKNFDLKYLMPLEQRLNTISARLKELEEPGAKASAEYASKAGIISPAIRDIAGVAGAKRDASVSRRNDRSK